MSTCVEYKNLPNNYIEVKVSVESIMIEKLQTRLLDLNTIRAMISCISTGMLWTLQTEDLKLEAHGFVKDDHECEKPSLCFGTIKYDLSEPKSRENALGLLHGLDAAMIYTMKTRRTHYAVDELFNPNLKALKFEEINGTKTSYTIIADGSVTMSREIVGEILTALSKIGVEMPWNDDGEVYDSGVNNTESWEILPTNYQARLALSVTNTHGKMHIQTVVINVEEIPTLLDLACKNGLFSRSDVKFSSGRCCYSWGMEEQEEEEEEKEDKMDKAVASIQKAMTAMNELAQSLKQK